MLNSLIIWQHGLSFKLILFSISALIFRHTGLCLLHHLHEIQFYCSRLGNLGFPRWLSGKESACNAGDTGSTPLLGRSPGEETGYPLIFLLEKSHRQRSLVGYSVTWGHKESDMIQQLSTYVPLSSSYCLVLLI